LADIIKGITNWIDTDFMHYRYTALNGMYLAPHEGGRTQLDLLEGHFDSPLEASDVYD
jgi:hypothetical protein